MVFLSLLSEDTCCVYIDVLNTCPPRLIYVSYYPLVSLHFLLWVCAKAQVDIFHRRLLGRLYFCLTWVVFLFLFVVCFFFFNSMVNKTISVFLSLMLLE